jgi:hypothetical protein
MSDKVVGGRGHKISPVGKGTSKIAYTYSPCPKIDPDISDNCLIPTPNGNLLRALDCGLLFFLYILILHPVLAPSVELNNKNEF